MGNRGLPVESGFEARPVPRLIGIIIGGGSLLLLFGGTAGTLWFIRLIRKDTGDYAAS
jgi:hypothetical protein